MKTTKFVVGYEEETLITTETLADAAEYLLSLAEENAYENFLYDINYYGDSIQDYIELLRDSIDSEDYKTIYGLALNNNCDGYWIDECVCLN